MICGTVLWKRQNQLYTTLAWTTIRGNLMLATNSIRRNVILTGIPRGGTTLAAALLDSLDDVVCIGEPDSHTAAVETTVSSCDFVRFLMNDFDQTRIKLLAGQPVIDKRERDGRPTTNYFSKDELTGQTKPTFELKEIRRPSLTPEFTLAMKHNAHYTSVLDEILKCSHFTVVAIVRNPVDTILSWRSLDLPVSYGRLPAADKYWREMRELTHSDLDLPEKHVRIFDLFCERYASLRDSMTILKYEDFTEDTTLLSNVVGRRPRFRGGVPVKKVKKYQDEAPAELVDTIDRFGLHLRKFYPQILR
jgi:hypothetical protein